MKKNRFLLLLIVCGAVVLSACGNNKNYQAKDKSEDYLLARSLPPLIKVQPSGQSSSIATPDIATPDIAAPSVIEPDAEPELKPVGDAVSEYWQLVTASDRYSRIQTNGPIEQAWVAFADKLTNAAVTIVGRNSQAKEYQVVCLDSMAEKPETKNVGGWSLFKSDDLAGEHCRFVFSDEGDLVEISYLSPTGDEVPSDVSSSLLAQIIN